MTVEELREELSHQDPEAEVGMALYDSRTDTTTTTSVMFISVEKARDETVLLVGID